MKRFVLTSVCVLFLTAGLISPASGADVRVPPSAPRDLTVSSTGSPVGSVRLSWNPPASVGGSMVRGYRITWVQQPKDAPTRLRIVSSRTRSVVLTALKPGATYLAQVAAYNRFGRGTWSKVTFNVPSTAAHADQLFAVDAKAATLVQFPLTGGPATVALTGVTAPTDLAIDPAGNAYLANNGTVTEVPVDGSTSRTVGSGDGVETDDAGNLYVSGSGGVKKTTPTGRTSAITTTDARYFAVAGDGTVKVLTSDGLIATISTYTAGASTPVVQTVTLRGLPRRVLDDDRGNLYLLEAAVGGSGASFWELIKAGSTSPEYLNTRIAEHGGAVGPDGHFYLAQSATFCFANSEDQGTCTPDRHVADILRYPVGGGTPTSIPVTGLSTSRYVGLSLAVDESGSLYAALLGDQPGLLRYPATGGTPTRLADGQYSLLTIG